MIDDVHHASLPIFPFSFAVAPDGSLWLVDAVKHRLAHFSPSGGFIGQIGGIRFDRFHPQPQDLVSIGDALYLLEQDHRRFLLSSVREYRNEHESAASQAENGTEPVIVVRLVSGATEPLGLIAGRAGDPVRLGEGQRGFAALSAEPPPNVRYIEGLPVDATTAVGLDADPDRPDDRYLFSFTSASERATLPIRVVATPAASEGSKRLSTSAGMQIQAILPDRIVAWVPVTPSRPADAERYGGGAWLFELPTDGSALVWERLPEPGISSEWQVRSFAAGPDGRLYFMRAERDGMRIYEVPAG